MQVNWSQKINSLQEELEKYKNETVQYFEDQIAGDSSKNKPLCLSKAYLEAKKKKMALK